MVFCTLANIVGFSLGNSNSVLLSYILQAAGSPALLCVLGSHLLIHLKEAGESGLDEGTESYGLYSLSVMDFGRPPKPHDFKSSK